MIAARIVCRHEAKHGQIPHAAELEASITVEIVSLERRLKLAQDAAEKHHEGNRAACEREAKLAEQLANIHAQRASITQPAIQ